VKEGWKKKRLGEVADVQSGGTPLVSNKAFWNGDLPWYSSGELNDLYTSDPERHISKTGLGTSNAKLFPAGSLLIGMYDTAALKMSILDRAGAFNQAIAGVRPNDQIDLVFILHAIGAMRESILGQRRGVRQKNLSLGKIRDIELTLPTISEQQRIVGILGEAFEGIATAKANAERNLQNVRALFESHLQSIFTQRGEGWSSQPFEDCIEDVKYTTKIQRKDFLEEGEYPIVSQEAGFINGYWNNAADVFKVTRPVVIFGDHTQVLKYVDFEFVLGADGVKILRPKQFLIPKYFFYHLRTAPLKALGYSRHYRLLKELEISYPDPDRQNAIIQKLDEFDAATQRLKSIYKSKLDALEALKRSLLHQAFSGQL
jgi:type I restriction enzyme, S subunit